MNRLINRNPNLTLGLVTIVLGCIILFLWIPADVETGVLEKVRSQISIGDSLAPTVAASILVLAGLILSVQSLSKRGEVELSSSNLKYLVVLLSILVLSINLMHWSGTWAVETAKFFGMLSDSDSYRILRDTAPWKYLGFIAGGVVLIFSLISLMERKLSLKALLIALSAVAVLIIIYDVPFDNILLPPNGDF